MPEAELKTGITEASEILLLVMKDRGMFVEQRIVQQTGP